MENKQFIQIDNSIFPVANIQKIYKDNNEVAICFNEYYNNRDRIYVFQNEKAEEIWRFLKNVSFTCPSPDEITDLPQCSLGLETYISFAKAGVRIGVILMVKGLVITGDIISPEEYYEKLTKQIPINENFPNVAETLKTILVRQVELHQKDEKFEKFCYIHLDNANFYFLSQPTTKVAKGLLWRGRLSEIDGFIIGTPSVQQT